MASAAAATASSASSSGLNAAVIRASEGANDLAAVAEWRRDELLALARSHGAVLFRGFAVKDADSFSRVVDALGFVEMAYVGGAAVRSEVVGSKVMTANESPPSAPIPPHHELSQAPAPPSHVCFFCERPASAGGETPLFDSRVVAEHVETAHPELFRDLESFGVQYVRVMPGEDDLSSPIGRSWRSTYGVETREEAEAAMAEQGTKAVEWLPDGSVRTITRVLPAVRRAGKRKAFFNSILAAATGWVDSRNDPSKAVVIHGRSDTHAAAIKSVAEWASENARISCPSWEASDVLLVDNSVAMHARAPFTDGSRRVLVALAGGVYPSRERAAELAAATASLTISNKREGEGDAVEMPVMGLGCWKIPQEATAETVCRAIRCGWRALDCAADYGNEKEVGDGIRLAIERGHISGREELFITGKLWCSDHRPEHVEAALDKTLSDLGTAYVDLYLIHFPIALEHVPHDVRYPAGWVHDPSADAPGMRLIDVPQSATWRAMEELALAGKARRVGVSNFSVALLRELIASSRFPPAVLQVELHPYLQQPKLLRFCEERGIAVTAFSPLGAPSYVPLGMAKHTDSALNHPEIRRVAAKHGVTAAKVCLAWGLHRGTAIVSKTTKPARLVENLEAASLRLDEEDMAAIAKLDQHRRFNDPGVFCELAFHTFCPIYE